MSVLAQGIMEMGKGKDLLEVMEELAPQFVEQEQKKDEAEAPQGEAPTQDFPDREEGQDILEGGGQLDIGQQAPPLQQQIVRNLY